MLHKEVSVDGVHGGHVHQTAPADVVARAVVLDVHRAEVAGLPVVELEQVHALQDDGDNHGAGHVTEHLVLLEGVADDAHLPIHEAKAAVGELLHVEAEDAGVQLGAPEEVNNQASVRAGILGRWEGESLDSQHSTEAHGEQVQGRQNVAHSVIHISGSDVPLVSEHKGNNNSD